MTASNVFLIICSLAWVKTCTVTSFGIMSRSINARMKLYSVSEAAGNPTSISLNPMSTSIRKNSSFSSSPIGSISAWLPSRRSTLHQMGGFSMLSFFTQSYVTSGGIKYDFPYFAAIFMSFLHTK